MGLGDAEPELVKLPLHLAQNPRARQERIAIRRARIKAKIAAAKRYTGSDDEDAPDADLDKLSSVVSHKHRRRSRSQSRGHLQGHSHAHAHSHASHAPGHSRSHAHGNSHHGHHGHHDANSQHHEQSHHQQAQQVIIGPGGKPIIPIVVEIDPILTIDQKLISHVEKSKKLLEQLFLDAETFVTNVKVAAEYRERSRHDRQEESKKDRLANLEKEAEECERMFKIVSENWFTSAKGVLPLELYEMIQEQQKSCDNLIEKKQDLIDSLKAEIDGNDVEYEADLQRHQKDLMLMGDRIDEQVEVMRLAFMKELDLLEEYTSKDRETLMEDNEKEWAQLMKEFDTSEAGTLDAMHSATMDRFNTLSDLYTLSREESRRMKVEIENDMRTLQLEAEQIKIAAILNAEKLEYNLEILRRRENENLRMKSSMKRLILNLQDRFNAKAKALHDIVQAAKRENALLIKQIRRLEVLNKDAMHKVLHEVVTDYRKYMDLWKMNEEEGRDKLTRLIETEKFIFENYLGLDVEETSYAILDARPDEVQEFFMKQFEIMDAAAKNSPVKEEEGQTRQGSGDTGSGANGTPGTEENLSAYEQFNKNRGGGGSDASLVIEPTNSLQFLPGPEPDPVVQRRLMKHITKVICDQTGFVIEEKLRKILSPMIQTEKSLIHIDAVLQALGVTNFSEMQILARYMLRESKVMRGIMSKMGTAVTPDISSMRLSVTGIPTNEQDAEDLILGLMAKVAQASRPQLDVEDEVEPRNVLVTASSSDFSVEGSHVVPESAQVILDRIEEEGIDQVLDFPTPSHQRGVKPAEDMSSGVLTPVSQVSDPSLEQIIDQFSSDESLVNVLRQIETGDGSASASTGRTTDAEETDGLATDHEIEASNSDSTCNSSSICSCESVQGGKNKGLVIKSKLESSVKTTDATVMSWAEGQQKVEVNPLSDEEGGSESSFMPKPSEDGTRTPPDADGEEAMRPVTLTSAGSGGRSQTISIPSLATTSAGSDEFLYIEPNDVLRALAAFCKDYNAKIKIELPTAAELIDVKLAKLRFPEDAAVKDYWGRFLILLDPKSHELWEAILKCFGFYCQVLHERNQMILDIERIYQENVELGYLMKKNYRGNCTGSNFVSFDPSGLPYCDC